MKLNKKLLTIITAVVLMGSIFLTYKLTKPVKHVEQGNISTLSEVKKLEKVTGGGLLIPQHIGEFAAYGSRDIKATVYNPIPINEAKNYLGSAFGSINFNIADNLPFKVGKNESYIVEVKIDNEKEMKKQAHFVYLPDKNPLGNYGEEFAVISVYEMDEAIINSVFQSLKKEDKDTFGNKREVLQKDGLTLISTKITTNSAFTYSYYQYKDANRQIVSTTTVANEIITHKNGLVYEVGYHLSNSTKEKEDKVLYTLINFIEAK